MGVGTVCYCSRFHRRSIYDLQTTSFGSPASDLNPRLLAAAVTVTFVSSFPATPALAHIPYDAGTALHPIQQLRIKDRPWLEPEFESQTEALVCETFHPEYSLEPVNGESTGIFRNPIAGCFHLNEETEKAPSVVSDTVHAPTVNPTASSGNSGSSEMVVTAALAGTEAVVQSRGTPVVGLHQTLVSVLHHLGGGGIAGAVGAAVVYPLDTIKTRLQAQRSKNGEEPEYEDELDCFRKLVANEGLASLYSGLIPQLLGIAPEKALKLTVNEVLLSMLEQAMPCVRVWVLEFIAGGGGGFSQVVVTNPMEIVKVRLQTRSKEGAPKNLWAVVKELGLRGLYSGSGITVARDVPSSAIFFAGYTLLRQLYPDQCFLDGCIAAIPATVLVTPFDVIKTRLQMDPPPGEEPYSNGWHCLNSIWQKEGPKALFKGNIARVLRTGPQFGITLLVYSLICEGH